MKKILSFILAFAETPLLKEGGDAFEKFLEAFREKNQEAADALVVGLYMGITTVGEDLVKKTTNEYDDHALAQLKKEVMDYAAHHSITLPEINK